MTTTSRGLSVSARIRYFESNCILRIVNSQEDPDPANHLVRAKLVPVECSNSQKIIVSLLHYINIFFIGPRAAKEQKKRLVSVLYLTSSF